MTSDDQAVVGGFLLAMLVVVSVIAVVVNLKERNRRLEAEVRLANLIAQQQMQGGKDGPSRDDIMFSQHKQMNELQIAKLTAEVELLQNQVKAKAIDDDRIEASKEYHELMVEKTRLEMDTLRLHLMELRKRARTEDWREE